MKKFLKWTAIVVVALVVLLFGAFKIMQSQTKKASPEATVAYVKNGKELSVFYCQPAKKGREIFGGLVPYGEVWRTGANEATTFTTNTDLQINGQILPAGKYTLWTIPGQDEWTVIWNTKHYGWGVSFGNKASREPEADALQVKVPVRNLDTPVETFTIDFDESEALAMVMAWDQTSVVVPIQ